LVYYEHIDQDFIDTYLEFLIVFFSMVMEEVVVGSLRQTMREHVLEKNLGEMVSLEEVVLDVIGLEDVGRCDENGNLKDLDNICSIGNANDDQADSCGDEPSEPSYYKEDTSLSHFHHNEDEKCNSEDFSFNGYVRFHDEKDDQITYCCGKSFKDYNTLIEHDQLCHEEEIVDDIISIDIEGNILYHLENPYLNYFTPQTKDGRFQEKNLYDYPCDNEDEFIVSSMGTRDISVSPERFEELERLDSFSILEPQLKSVDSELDETSELDAYILLDENELEDKDSKVESFNSIEINVNTTVDTATALTSRKHLDKNPLSTHLQPSSDKTSDSDLGISETLLCSEEEEIHSNSKLDYHSLELFEKYDDYHIEKKKKRKLQLYQCSIDRCNKIYTSTNGLKYHQDHGHKEEPCDVNKPHICHFTDCTKRFKSANGLSYHIKNVHRKNRPLRSAIIATTAATIQHKQPIEIVQNPKGGHNKEMSLSNSNTIEILKDSLIDENSILNNFNYLNESIYSHIAIEPFTSMNLKDDIHYGLFHDCLSQELP
jgi:hypothetical protein